MKTLFFILVLLLSGSSYGQDGQRRSDYRVNKMYDTTQSHPAHKRRDMTVQLGDSTRSGRLMSGRQFSPSFSFSGWGGDVSFRIHLASGFDSLKTAARENLTYKGQHRLRLTTSKVIHDIRTEDWGVIWDMILLSKPDRNVFKFKFESKGLTFSYQDTLSMEQRLRGDNRPDSVVGSYTIYHSTKSNNRDVRHPTILDSIISSEHHGIGKFAHIYRPKAWDSDGDTVWCRINIDTILGLIRLIVPQAFLNRAVYPVTLDPDIGKTDVGASTATMHSSRAHGHCEDATSYVASTGDQITGYSMYCVSVSTSNFDMAAYNLLGASESYTLDARVGAANDIAVTSSVGWFSVSGLTDGLSNGVRYGSAYGNHQGEVVTTYYDTPSAIGRRRQASKQLGVTFADNIQSGVRISHYFTYTASGAPAPSTRRRKVLLGGK